MKGKKLIALALAAAVVTPAVAQEKKENGKGKVIATVFTNFYTGFGATRDSRGFGLDRAYLGYDYKFGNGVELKAVADFSNLGESKGLIKNAFAKWTINEHWTVQGGLISTTQFKTQESFWGKRYIMKSFQDEYKFGSSADLGISAAYKFNKILSADVIIVNGQGYKHIQASKGLQYGGGLTITPSDHWVIRLYGSYNEAPLQEVNGTTNLACFVGYRTDGFSIGGEYNYMWTAKGCDGKQVEYNQAGEVTKNGAQSGFSVYATGRVASNCDLFARYDMLMSEDNWNATGTENTNDGSTVIVGADIKLNKHIAIAPNFRLGIPKQDGADVKPYVYLNAMFNL